MPRVSALFVYPIKSCGGVALSEARVVARGLEHDRRWMVVDQAGRFLTQRQLPEMALVRVALHGDELLVAHPRSGRLSLPIELEGDADRRDVTVWRDTLSARIHPEGSRFFSDALGRSCQLVYMPNDQRRAVNPARARPGDVVSFADGYPLLLLSQSSLADLNARLAEPVGIERFRPNLVIEGAPAYAEDTWSQMETPELRFRIPKACDRCAIPCVDPATGERGTEPLRTLATYRKWDGAVWFGANLIHDGPGTLRVGEPVRVQ